MEKDVLGLEVAVQDIVVVHILHSVADLLDDQPDLVLGEAALLFEVVVHVPVGAELQQQVEVVVFDENGVELGDVWVVQEGLDLYLAD